MENSLRLSEEAYQPRPNAGGTTTDAPRELSTFNVTPTNSNSRDDATREYPNNHDRSPGSNSQVDYTRESSIAHDKVTTSTSQDKYEEDAIQINNEINDGDPLLDDEKLVQGPRLAQPGDDGLNALIKVPSDQVLAKFRWGSKHRTSGRAKTGLLIQVPGRETSISLVKGGPITGNSIMYAYTSSSSSSGRTTNSFGAVGDHLSSTTKSNRWSLNALPSVKEDSSAASHESRIYHPENSALASAGANVRSPLANLLHDSIPDSIFPLLAVGEAGPLQQPVAAQIVAPSSVRTLRRRSLSDLIEPHPLLSSSARQEASNSIGTQMIAAEPTQTAPVWHRTGPPFLPGTRHTTRGVNNSFPLDEYLDPEAFTLPYGSKVYIMKAKNLINLRASVIHGVWSCNPGVGKVFQDEWEQKIGDEKIVFLFSIVRGNKHRSKYCGMAEMSGAYDPVSNPEIWTEDMQVNEGSLPIRWIVAKDVPFPVFDGQKHNETAVTMMRHGNIVVGEVGRRLMQTYFEHEHGDSAIIHPEYDLDRAQSRKTPTRQRNNCGRRNWNQGSNRHGARPRYRHHTNSVASNDPLTFEQAPTYQPPFGLANHGYRTQLQNAQPYSPSPSMHTPPGHGLPYECDLRFDADIGSATRQALPGHTLQYGPHASIHLGSQASAGNTSAGYAPQFGHVHPVNPNIRPGHPPPSHQNHFGLDSPTIHAPMYGHHIGQLAPSHEPHVGRWPPVNLIDSPRHALPPRETHFGSVAPTLQPPVFNPRFGQEAPSNGSYFGHIPLTSQPAVYGHRFGPAAPYKEPHFRCSPQARAPPAPNPRFGRAPRYLPLGYAPPVRGSQFEHEQPHTRAQQAPQAHVFEVVSGGEYEHPPIQDPVYDWAS